MPRYFLHLGYDGTRYHGWQRQPNGITVQQNLEDSLSMIWRFPVKLTGAGRTDTGVHASDFYAHFDSLHYFSEAERLSWIFKLNSYLPPDIVIYRILPVSDHAHARFSACSRTYRYCVARSKSPFRSNYTHYIYGTLNQDKMNDAAAMLLHYEDFTSFSKVDTDTKTNICRVSHAAWELENDELVFTITADRFLRNMVRAIVGTLLEIGKGKLLVEDMAVIIESMNRSEAGDSVPARGLILHHIEYPQDIFI